MFELHIKNTQIMINLLWIATGNKKESNSDLVLCLSYRQRFSSLSPSSLSFCKVVWSLLSSLISPSFPSVSQDQKPCSHSVPPTYSVPFYGHIHSHSSQLSPIQTLDYRIPVSPLYYFVCFTWCMLVVTFEYKGYKGGYVGASKSVPLTSIITAPSFGILKKEKFLPEWIMHLYLFKKKSHDQNSCNVIISLFQSLCSF